MASNREYKRPPTKAAAIKARATTKPVEKSLLDSVLDNATGRRQVGFYNSKTKYPARAGRKAGF